MEKIKFPVFEFSQNSTKFLSVVLPMKVLDAVSTVLVYGKDEDGYQRLPNKIHYNKIKKYIDDKPNDFMLPTSIILGANMDEITPLIEEKDGVKYISVDINKKLFRIVDGQHRIFGLREASKNNNSILELPLNVIVILSKEGEKSKELQIFSDINSKGKRINTDLAELAKHDYQIKENQLEDNDINRHVAVKTAYYLKDQKGSNVWQNAIKFDIHSEISIGIIGVTLFSESIRSIVNKYLIDNKYVNASGEKLRGQELINYTDNASQELGKFMLKVWNEIISVKWPGAFREDVLKNDEGELVKIFYNKDFYIQKGLGIKSLNQIIGDTVQIMGINDDAYEKIKSIVFGSKVKIDDWKNGGPFSGYNSESGFSKIKQMVMNVMPVPTILPA